LRDFIAARATVEDLAWARASLDTNETNSTRREVQMRRGTRPLIIWVISLRPRKSRVERQIMRESETLFRHSSPGSPDGNEVLSGLGACTLSVGWGLWTESEFNFGNQDTRTS